MEQHDDNEVARGLCDGDVNAWQRLYDAHAQRVWRLVARAMEPGSQDVADVVQETFLAAARSARTYDEARGSLTLWLNGIATRQVAFHYRRQKRHYSVGGAGTSFGSVRSDNTGTNACRSTNPAAAADFAELASQVRATLTMLPTGYEVLLTLKYLDGVTIEQIATAEKSTSEAIRSKLARARRAFRRAFKRSYPESTGTFLGGHDES